MRPIDADTLKKRFGRKIRQLIHAMEYGKVLTNDNEASVKEFYEAVCEEIDNEPTINDWIPCKKCQPSECGEYEVTIEQDGKRTTRYAQYSKSNGWYVYSEACYTTMILTDVVTAWKPKPKPYKGGTSK